MRVLPTWRRHTRHGGKTFCQRVRLRQKRKQPRISSKSRSHPSTHPRTKRNHLEVNGSHPSVGDAVVAADLVAAGAKVRAGRRTLRSVVAEAPPLAITHSAQPPGHAWAWMRRSIGNFSSQNHYQKRTPTDASVCRSSGCNPSFLLSRFARPLHFSATTTFLVRFVSGAFVDSVSVAR